MNQTERLKYVRMWERPEYRQSSPGERVALKAASLLGVQPGQKIVDWGCGTGRALKVFHNLGLVCTGVDIAANSVDKEFLAIQERLFFLLGIDIVEAAREHFSGSRAAAWSFCTDVLEHLPEEEVEASIAAIAHSTLCGAFIQVANNEDDCGQMIGEVLHLTIKPKEWWQDLIGRYFAIESSGEGDRPGKFWFVGRG